MTFIWILLDWALRGAALAALGGGLLWMLRVRDVSARLAAWVAVLGATMAVPLLMMVVPGVLPNPVTTLKAAADGPAPEPGYFGYAAAAIYATAALLLVGRVLAGVWLMHRLAKRARPLEWPGVYESEAVRVPITVGILKPAVLLPAEWREWDETARAGILAHELGHVERHDTRVQVLSALHRAVLWFSPVSWWLHAEIARLAEEASDDRAMACVADRGGYAEILLRFAGRMRKRVVWSGVAMARTARVEQRIDRILSGHALSAGLRGRTLMTILALAVPLACAAAAARMADPPQPPQAPRVPKAAAPVAPAKAAAKPSPVVQPPAPAAEVDVAPAAPPTPEAVADELLDGVVEGVIAGVPVKIEESVKQLNEDLAELSELKAERMLELQQHAELLSQQSRRHTALAQLNDQKLRQLETKLQQMVRSMPTQAQMDQLRRSIEELSRKLSERMK